MFIVTLQMSFSAFADTNSMNTLEPVIDVQDKEAYFDDAGVMDAINSINDVDKKRILKGFLCTPAYSFVSHNDMETDMEIFHQQFLDALNIIESVKDLPMDEFEKAVNNESKGHIENILSKKDIVINPAF